MELDHGVNENLGHRWSCEWMSKGNKVGKLGETIDNHQNAIISIG
jgi:hypothetical protein